MVDSRNHVVRRAARALALTPAAVVTLAATAAVAAPPEQWEDAEPVSALSFLLLLVGIPAALFLVITVLTLAPAMARGGAQRPGAAWRNESEWFGGPTGGLEATDKADPAAIESHDESSRGGASARW